MILVLGVIDFPYTNEPPAPKKIGKAKTGKANKPKAGAAVANAAPVTTGQVAEWLENKYHVMETFAERQAPVIEMEVHAALAKQIRSLSMGAPIGDNLGDIFKRATSEIEREFRTFLDENELEDAGVPGVPTKAAQMGVNHRFKSKLNNVSMADKESGVRRGDPRPSFIDTGTYQKAFKAWTE